MSGSSVLSIGSITEIVSEYKNYTVPLVDKKEITGEISLSGSDVMVNTELGLVKLDQSYRRSSLNYKGRRKDTRIDTTNSAFQYYKDKEIPNGTILVNPGKQITPLRLNYVRFKDVASDPKYLDGNARKVIDAFVMRDKLLELFEHGLLKKSQILSFIEDDHPERAFVAHGLANQLFEKKDVPQALLHWTNTSAEKEAEKMQVDPPLQIKDEPLQYTLVQNRHKAPPKPAWGVLMDAPFELLEVQ